MILNLNQTNLRDLGTILPERSYNDSPSGSGKHQILQLTDTDSPIYLTKSETWISCNSGSTVLSLSRDGQNFIDFYLDKTLCIKQGIYFSLAAFQDVGSAKIAADKAPVISGSRAQSAGFTVSNHMRVENLYTFFYQEKEQGFFFAGEAHPMLELTYVDQGSLHSVADGTDMLLQQGDMVLYGPGQWHMQYADMEIAPRFVTISFDIAGSDLSCLYNRRFRTSQKVAKLLQQMLQEQERMDSYASDMIISLLNQLLLTLLREMDAPVAALQRAGTANNENDIISRAQQFISANIRQKLSVPIVAENVGVSASYLTALFQKHLQISPGEYIRRIKLQESKQMIRQNSMNFTQIATALQYSTVHHFSRQFKEKFGITPSEYAKSVK